MPSLYLLKENLALNKHTWQEHPWPDSTRDFGSENAVDGLYTDRGIGGHCTINTDGYYTAEWRVDLGSVVTSISTTGRITWVCRLSSHIIIALYVYN